MSREVVVIVDLGHEDCRIIKEDVQSMGVEAVICSHDVSADELESLGDIKGIILNGGPHKKVNGFRVDASEAVYDSDLPMFSVDHASMVGVDLFQWPDDVESRRNYIWEFLKDGCGLLI